LDHHGVGHLEQITLIGLPLEQCECRVCRVPCVSCVPSLTTSIAIP
jgi:hypothetical protein